MKSRGNTMKAISNKSMKRGRGLYRLNESYLDASFD